jgi:hypothetical protein
MNPCWLCKQPITTINEGFVGDVRCPNPICGVLNSFYAPEDFVPMPPEDKDDKLPD